LMTGPGGHKACGIALAYNGDVAEGQRVVAPLKNFGSPVLDIVGPMPYTAQQGLLEAAMPPNLNNYWKAEFIHDISANVIDVAIDAFSRVPSPNSSILFFPIRGIASRVPPEATAFPHRHGYHVGIYALWSDKTANDANVSWVRQAWERLQPHAAGGVYVNELGDDEGADRVQLAYGVNYERLQRIKTRYDPDNMFCLNANIAPARVAEAI
jgi:FAD/FMN-containing dehydrogenase